MARAANPCFSLACAEYFLAHYQHALIAQYELQYKITNIKIKTKFFYFLVSNLLKQAVIVLKTRRRNLMLRPLGTATYRTRLGTSKMSKKAKILLLIIASYLHKNLYTAKYFLRKDLSNALLNALLATVFAKIYCI